VSFIESEGVRVYHGDCRDIMEGQLADNSVDSIVTDPPYELGFMGKKWDDTGIAYNCEVWENAYRVLKPGGHLLAFGGTRTWHRLAVAIEDAGFEVRDSMAWMYGSGFPKSLDVSKGIDKAAGAQRVVVGQRKVSESDLGQSSGWNALDTTSGIYNYTAPATPAAQQWQGWGTALKPAHEPIVVARKPLIGTVAENVLTHGTGALNIDGCRIRYASDADKDSAQALADLRAKGRRLGVLGERGQGQSLAVAQSGDTRDGTEQLQQNTLGRWPANVILDESQAAKLDKQTGVLHSQDPLTRSAKRGSSHFGSISDDTTHSRAYNDSGGASRFFYVAKAGKRERPNVDGVAHPTVKPIALMRYLVRLVTPPGGTVLEPFAGSGTTVEACILEGFDCIAIEMTDDYLPLIAERVRRSTEDKEGRLL
jgi:site-specific DNA-methyltransferase (adenine-specific)